MIAHDLSRAGWRRSTYSGSNGNCLEAAGNGRIIAVRDSKDPDGPCLAFDPTAWRKFAARLNNEG
jgi:hypothetical protein